MCVPLAAGGTYMKSMTSPLWTACPSVTVRKVAQKPGDASGTIGSMLYSKSHRVPSGSCAMPTITPYRSFVPTCIEFVTRSTTPSATARIAGYEDGPLPP